MKLIPAIDVREGACVQLVGGDYANERVRLTDVGAVAAKWRAAGFSSLHLVDLDAATGRGDNRALLTQVIAGAGIPAQVGGGVRDEASIAAWLSAGAARVVIGTRAIENFEWLSQMAAKYPAKLVIAADVRGTEVVTHGWSKGSGVGLQALLEKLSALPLAGVLVTAVHVEGQLGGTDLTVMALARKATKLPVIASGGVTSVEDLKSLDALGIDGAVVGMALYTGRLDAAAIPQEYK